MAQSGEIYSGAILASAREGMSKTARGLTVGGAVVGGAGAYFLGAASFPELLIGSSAGAFGGHELGKIIHHLRRPAGENGRTE